MKKIFLLFMLLQLPTLIGSLGAQASKEHFYIGTSVNCLGYWEELYGDKEGGFGIEGGMKFNKFYLGVEYGIYGIIHRAINTAEEGISYGAYDELKDIEHYFGIHAGFVIDNKIWVGAVFLGNTTSITHFDYDSTIKEWNTSRFQKYWFNVGPDIRYQPSDHFTIDLAYTIRRGLKMGVAYIF